MSEKILVPMLGESITEATVSKWLKKIGETVEADEAIVELETDKVNLEVPSPISGTLSEISFKDGDAVEVGAILGSISEGNVEIKKEVETKKHPEKNEEKEVIDKESNVINLEIEKKSEINELLRGIEQAFISDKGLPRREWFKNMLYAPGYYTGYGVKTLPGIREGLEERKWSEVRLYINEVAKSLDRAGNNINLASRILNEN